VPGLEPRGALWLEVSLGQARLQVINTHLGLLPLEQHRQVKTLTGPKWLGDPRCQDPTILIGDFNFTSVTGPYRHLARQMRDAQRVAGLDRSVKTFPSAFPTIRIDHCFISPGITIRRVHAPFHPLARLASDHLPLVFDFDLVGGDDQDAAGDLSH
jgi:endonuclease/exonuclease/phosphatase family metal-dependent hydrolase